MDPERRRQIDRVLGAALELEEADRRAYLDGACADDAELRAEVESRLGLDLAGPFAVGSVVGHYRIEAPLGEGGMGAVFRARDERLGRAAAIKIVSGGARPELARRFMREARLASALNHPNILIVYDVGEAAGVPYLVTELVEGESLRARIESGMAHDDAVEVARQMASALGSAHEAGIVHRDVKPENVIVRGDGLVKVLDFGIAKLVGRTDSNGADVDTRTAPGVMVGTTSYVSPEQARGEEVDGRADVWSLGVVLYEMLAGHRPFRGETRIDVIAAVLRAEAEPLVDVPKELAAVVERALKKRADERYATAAEMAAALDASKGRRRDDGPATDEGSPKTSERAAPTTNLVIELGPLIGRERELRAVVDELRHTRLLTLTGPGGTGKTRVAAEAGRALLREFEHGVFFVELSAIRDPALVVSAVARTLGVQEGGGSSLEETLAKYLADRELLLVLDNFEQVLAAAPFVARLIAAAPKLKAIVTSRERLHVSAERELAIAPLALPPPGRLASADALAKYGSVALLVARARAVRPSFALDALGDASRAAVAEICRRLDGLPLAIELAAARLRMLTPEALLARLDRQLKLLTGGARDLPERQRTMWAAIAWSYDLLDERERALLRRLTVFAGGWSLEAAEAVCGDDETDALDGLGSLVDKSLVRWREQADGEGRFSMLEVVREYGLERLEESGEADDRRLAHARWFLRLGEELAPVFASMEVVSALERAVRDRENLGSALAFLIERRPEEGTRLAAALLPYWTARGLHSEGLDRFRRALETGAAAPAVRARLLLGAAENLRYLGSPDESSEYARACAEVCRAIGDRKLLALALNVSGMICLGDEEFARARAYFEEGLSLAREIGYRRLEGLFLGNLAEAALIEGDYAASRGFGEAALELEGPDSRTDPAIAFLATLGIACCRTGDSAAARSYAAKALSIAAEFAHPLYCGYALDGLAAAALATGETELAARLAGAAEAFYECTETPVERAERAFRDEVVARLREALDADAFAREWALGRATTFEDAARLASEALAG